MSYLRWVFLVICGLSGPLFAREWDLPALLDEAAQHNPEILEQQCELHVAASLVDLARAAFYPTVGLEGGVIGEYLDVRTDEFGYGTVHGEWNLYRGGADAAHLSGVRAEHSANHRKLCHLMKTVSQQVAEHYYHLVTLVSLRAVYDEAIARNGCTSETVEQQLTSGLITEVDALTIELQKETLLGEKALLDEEIAEQRHLLAGILGNPCYAEGLEIKGTFPERAFFEKEGLCQLAMRCRDDLRAAELTACAQRWKIDEIGAAYRPTVGVLGSYGIEPEVDDDRGFGGKVALHVSWPLWQGGATYHAKQAAQQEWRCLNAEICRLKKRIITDIETALSRLRRADLTVDLAHKKRKALKHLWEKTCDEYGRGMKSPGDMVDAIERWIEIEKATLEAHEAYAVTLGELAVAVGLSSHNHPRLVSTARNWGSSSDTAGK